MQLKAMNTSKYCTNMTWVERKTIMVEEVQEDRHLLLISTKQLSSSIRIGIT